MRETDGPSGILVVDKPSGPTSHDVVDQARRALGLRRVGHTGTLDPFATGVLPLCVGKATRLARFLSQTDKRYHALIRFGFATSTDDRLGEPLGEPRPVALTAAELLAACRQFVGERMQVPPVFSAKRRGGRRLYQMAREGRPVAPDPVRVRVHRIDVLSLEADRAEIDVECGAGTYVRALARDLGEQLGPGAHLLALRRTRSGAFGLEGAVPGDALDPATALAALVPMADALPDLPCLKVGAAGLDAVRHGRALGRDAVLDGFPPVPPPRARVLDEQGRLVALAVPRGFGAAVPGLPIEPVYHPDVVLLD